MGMRRHPRGDSAFVGVTPTQAGVAYQPAAILNIQGSVFERFEAERFEIALIVGLLQFEF